MSFYTDLKLDVLYEAIKIKEEIQLLENRLVQLFGSHPPSLAALPEKVKRRKMSASARAKIGAAQKARWTKLKGTSVPAALRVKSPLDEPPTRKKGITPEGRAKLAAAMKARWAARKNGTPALNAKKSTAGRKRIANAGQPKFKIV